MKPVKPQYFILLFACLSANTLLKSQVRPGTSEKFYAEHFGDEQGLPQNSVNSILPDNNDFLWVATESGVARFNGNRFLPVTKLSTATGNFTRIKSFYAVGKDTILAYSAAAHQVAVIVNNKIVAIEKQSYQKHGMFFLNLHQALPAPAFVLNKTSGMLQQWEIGQGIFNGTDCSKDTFLVTLMDGIGVYNSNGLVNTIKIDNIGYRRLIYVNHQALYVDAENMVNFYAANGLLFKKPLPVQTSSKILVYGNSFGNNFYCVADSVLYRIDVSASGDLNATTLLDNLQNADDITTVYQKDSNIIITGTLRSGLYVYKRKSFSVTEVLPKGESDIFYVQQLLKDNTTVFTGGDKFFIGNKLVGKSKTPLQSHPYSSLKDKQGNYWYVYKNKVLCTKEIGVNADTLLRITASPGIFFEDAAGRVWFSSGGQFGYFINKKIYRFSFKKFSTRFDHLYTTRCFG